jgi:Bacterial SCP ortholog
MDRKELAAVVKESVRAFARKVPGHAVELRVPPFVAVQCVEGPRHTRGTPPNIVETDPASWLALADGSLGWAEAIADGRVSASGPRSDLSAYLPL